MSQSHSHKALRAMENGWRSKRLVYRAVEDNEEDRKYCHDVFHNDPVILGQAYLELFKPQSRRMSTDLFALWPKDKLLAVLICLPSSSPEMIAESHEGGRGVSEKETNEVGKTTSSPKPVPIGAVTLTRAIPELQQHRRTELGVIIAAPYRGKGYGSEAINWAVDWAFEFAGLHRVTVIAVGFNNGALRLYERLGFVKEGVQRESVWFHGQWWDEILYGMLDSDWEKLRSIR
jgi:RimJ/RimL family protein N-acetyltransferase